MKTKIYTRLISIIMTMSVVISSICCFPYKSFSATLYNVSTSYSGNYDSESPMQFDVYSLNRNTSTFTGHITIDATSLSINIDKDVSGTVTFYQNYYVCNFSFKYKWLVISFDTTFSITVYPREGKAVGYGGGGMLVPSADDFVLTGSIDNSYNKYLSYNSDDMKLCMMLSKEIYGTEKEAFPNMKFLSLIDKNFLNGIDKVQLFNTKDHNPDNVSFALLQRNIDKESTDLFVVIRGTLWNEWQGNVQITGKNYDSSSTVHNNFNKAKESIKDAICEYYNTYCKNYKKVNLIITGHSRGAAVANLYAKEATDTTESNEKNITETLRIPKFDTVTAYTFACPNNVRITKNNTIDKIESYSNIYNYWFTTDIVPSVPLTTPTDGWNYWKYGTCFTMDITSLDDWSFNKEIANFSLYLSGPLNKNIKTELNNAFSQWNSIEEYYNKQFKTISGYSPKQILFENISLYDFLYNATYFMTNSYSKLYGVKAIKDIIEVPRLKPLLCFAISNIGSISTSHHYDTYNKFINGDNNSNAFGDSEFKLFTYSQAINTLNNSKENSDFAVQNDNAVAPNLNEVLKLKEIANQNNNNEILDWNLNNPSEWSGITWNSTGHVVGIDFSYKWLEGVADFSDFSELENLDLYANTFTKIDLSGCIELNSLNCSYNDLSKNGLVLTDCNNLKTLYCDGCDLSLLDLSALTELKSLSGSFNNLISLNLENNTKLTYVNCIYNYLDVHTGSTLYNYLFDYKNNNMAYVNYFQQKLPSNAVTDASEIQALENFAKYGTNNKALDWLDDNEKLSLEKIQNNVMFYFDGEKYRAVMINMNGLGVSGTLELSDFDELRIINCEDTAISKLNLNNCNKLQELYCSNSQIENLTLPNNITSSDSNLFVLECENNHIDINIFSEKIISNIKKKSNYSLKYRHQIINKEISVFNENDYQILCDFANQKNNMSILNWNLKKPGEWAETDWIYDSVSEKYRLYDCNFNCLKLDGNIDLSGCTKIDNIDFASNNIRTVTLPVRNINEGEFYNCSKLEAVILQGGTTISSGAFMNCPTLQAIYIPDSIADIFDDAFANSSKVTICANTGSFAEAFANKKGINFKSGSFLCGNIVAMESPNNIYGHYYPVEEVNISNEAGNISKSDKYGYFVVYSLKNGNYDFALDYKYGYNLHLKVKICDSSVVISTPITMICCDFNKDGYINAKDFAVLKKHINGYESTIDNKYFDINKDGIVDDDDWKIGKKFLLCKNNNEIIMSYSNAEYDIIPATAETAGNEEEKPNGIDVVDGGLD